MRIQIGQKLKVGGRGRGALMSLGVLAWALAAEADTWQELTPEREIRLALSAAPEHLRPGAAVYVRGDKGFERVRESANGFACLVLRGGGIYAPVCYDREGARTTLLANLRQEALRASGITEEEVNAVLEREYAEGKLEAPTRPGIAYMLSQEFVEVDPETGETKQFFPPHLMFYAPYLTNEDIGATEADNGSYTKPWILSPGTPSAYVIVVPPEHVPDGG